MSRAGALKRARTARGQSLVEFALVLPLVLVVVLGVVEVSYLLLHQHVVTKLSREGSNLISRDVSLGDAALALQGMATAPVDFSNGSKVIFSVIKKGSTTGTSNYDQNVLYERYEFGSLAATSTIQTRGSGSFSTDPDHVAANSDSDTNLQVTSLPSNAVATGGMIYVT